MTGTATAPSTPPTTTPPRTSVKWWMRTTTLLIATMTATAHHSAARGQPVNDVRMIAAKVADDAWPLGKLDVRGFLTRVRSSPCHVGRSRLNMRFTPWFTTRLSTPRATDNAAASRKRSRLPIAYTSPATCHTTLKSPTWLALVNTFALVRDRRRGSRIESTLSSIRVTVVSPPTPRVPRSRHVTDHHRTRGTTVDSRNSCRADPFLFRTARSRTSA